MLPEYLGEWNIMSNGTKTPAHLWIVGAVSLLWNCVGASDFAFTMLNSEFWLAGFTEAQVTHFNSSPAWANAAWGLGTWGSLIGSVLLLLRSRHAMIAFLLSLIGLAGTTYYQFGMNFDKVTGLFGPMAIYVHIAVWAILIALILYTRRQIAAGVLR